MSDKKTFVTLHCEGKAGETKSDTVTCYSDFKGTEMMASDRRALPPPSSASDAYNVYADPYFDGGEVNYGTSWLGRKATWASRFLRRLWPGWRLLIPSRGIARIVPPPSSGTISVLQAIYVGQKAQFTNHRQEMPTTHLLAPVKCDLDLCPHSYCITATVRFLEDGEWWLTIFGENIEPAKDEAKKDVLGGFDGEIKS